MLSFLQIRALVSGIINADNAAKQDLGRRFAEFLGLIPGPRGTDDGIDGWLEFEKKRIHFQCKLSAETLNKDEARKYFSDIDYHKAHVSIMLAGVGFKDTLHKRLRGHEAIEAVRIHLLTLEDLFGETKAFQEAQKDLPKLGGLSKVLMSPAD